MLLACPTLSTVSRFGWCRSYLLPLELNSNGTALDSLAYGFQTIAFVNPTPARTASRGAIGWFNRPRVRARFTPNGPTAKSTGTTWNYSSLIKPTPETITPSGTTIDSGKPSARTLVGASTD